MNMNDKEWNEIWDNEPDEDDDYNDIGSDIDANNDETFDNAAEWNEDEHEELIARDSILSHTIPRNSNNNINNNDNNSSSSNNYNNINNNVFRESGTTQTNTSNRQVLTVDELEQQLLKTRISHTQIINEPLNEPVTKRTPTFLNEAHKRAGWSPFAGKDLFTASSPTTQAQLGAINQNLLLGNPLPHSLTLEQQQQLLLQHHLLLQQQQQQQQQPQQQQQLAFLKRQQIEQEQKLISQNPQCFTVEELERQMFANRSANNSQVDNNVVHSVNLITLNEEPNNKSRRSNNQRHDLQHVNQINGNRRDGERQDRYERLDRVFKESRDQKDSRNTHREIRDSKESRESRNNKDNYRDNQRDHHRESQRNHRDNHHHHRQHLRRPITIIPPQVQLKVIDKAKMLHSITAMHHDEFLQDRLPTSENGFMFKRYSSVIDEKPIHDGVLTEKERNWLTKIQEKIQADYDDNLDQDYYYLLYFNRSAQKPCGPGVLDRRFIPRERLLYNSNT